MKMTGIERKLICWLEKHKWLLLYAIVTLLSMIARFTLRGMISGDMDIFLLPWARVLKEEGGIHALKTQVGNYGVLYQTVIAVMTYLPIQFEYSYKAFSMIFDFALALVSMAIVKDISQSKFKTFLAYAFVIMLPTVMLNSAAWGQCDSVYSFFCVLCFWLLSRKKNTLAFLSYGVAFAFKLQTIFLMPFLILHYLKEKKYSLFNFFLIPVVMIVSSIAGILEGRSVFSAFEVYLEQAGYYSAISLNYPSFWNLLTCLDAEMVYNLLSVFCIAFTLLILLMELLELMRKKAFFSSKTSLYAAFLMTYTCVLFLPDMHERYSYLYIIFGLLLAILEPRTAISYVILIILDLQTYGAFLFDPERFSMDMEKMVYLDAFPINVLSLLNVLCFLSYVFIWGRRFFRLPSERLGYTRDIETI